jgi:hypothetical protein
VLRTVAEEGDATGGVASAVGSAATDSDEESTGKLVERIIGVTWTGAAAGSSTTLLVLDFTWGAGLDTTSKRGVTGVVGPAVIVAAAGCTSSCEPMEINGAAGFGAALIGDVTVGGFTTGEKQAPRKFLLAAP